MWRKPIFSLLLLFVSLTAFATPEARVCGDLRFLGHRGTAATWLCLPSRSAFRPDNALFYWHLGDFRAIETIDLDYVQAHRTTNSGAAPTLKDYWADAWDDFIYNQLTYFGSTPVSLGWVITKSHRQKTIAK